jgi:hypothetical protein
MSLPNLKLPVKYYPEYANGPTQVIISHESEEKLSGPIFRNNVYLKPFKCFSLNLADRILNTTAELPVAIPTESSIRK